MSATNRDPDAIAQLNQMQRYLGEETIEDYQEGHMTRRAMLKRLVLICGGGAAAAALLAACGDNITTPASPTAALSPSTATAVTTPSATPTVATPTAAATPSAAAKSPLSVAATDPAISATMVSYQSEIAMTGYLARPAATGTYPGVVVIHENKGLTDHIKDVTRRLAKAGYVALAPDLASRGGGTTSLTPDQVTAFLGKVAPDQLMNDLNTTADYLNKHDGVTSGKLGVVGFCFGGAYCLRLAAGNNLIAAAVAYYGVTPDPADQMAATHAAILAQYGGKDQRVLATEPALEKVLTANGKTFAKKVYDDANHAFNNDTGATYNEAAALAAWTETLNWLRIYLKA